MSATISILGNAGTDATLKRTPQGTPVATFSIASNSFRNTREGREKRTDWFNVSAYGKLAESLAANVRKGTHLLVRGSLTFSPWLSRDNEPQVSAEVVLCDFELASWGSGENDDRATESQNARGEFAADNEPFVDQF